MILDGKPTRDITVDELRRLVADRVTEDRHLDFKQTAYSQTDSGTKELIKDVTAFANADGGYIIIGAQEDGDGRVTGFADVPDAENARRSIIDRCLARIDPRPRGLDVAVFGVDGTTILVIHVPESDRKPHCARPDAEHHYFWRRYEDGNKLMSTAEIRECFEGDRVYRELAELRRESVEHAREHIVSRESEMEIDEGNLFALQSEEVFLRHQEQQFLAEVGNTPYYRLWATPFPVNQLNLRDRATELIRVLRSPPKLREGGWDVTPVGDFRQTAIGLVCERTDFRHLRLLWNGHLEFWTRADDTAFHWDESNSRPPYRLLFPYAIIEAAACFVRLAAQIYHIDEYHEQLRCGLGLYGIEGQFLLPGAPDTFGYMMDRSHIGQPYGPQPFGSRRLIVSPVDAQADDLPNAVAWHLVSQLYYRFGYADDQIPLFDAQHQCTLGDGQPGQT